MKEIVFSVPQGWFTDEANVANYADDNASYAYENTSYWMVKVTERFKVCSSKMFTWFENTWMKANTEK